MSEDTDEEILALEEVASFSFQNHNYKLYYMPQFDEPFIFARKRKAKKSKWVAHQKRFKTEQEFKEFILTNLVGYTKTKKETK